MWQRIKPFRDRRAAGRQLAAKLRRRLEDLGAIRAAEATLAIGAPSAGGPADLLVLALPRGGVPVAYEVAEVLGATQAALYALRTGTARLDHSAGSGSAGATAKPK